MFLEQIQVNAGPVCEWLIQDYPSISTYGVLFSGQMAGYLSSTPPPSWGWSATFPWTSAPGRLPHSAPLSLPGAHRIVCTLYHGLSWTTQCCRQCCQNCACSLPLRPSHLVCARKHPDVSVSGSVRLQTSLSINDGPHLSLTGRYVQPVLV